MVQSEISRERKVQVYRSSVLSILLYNAETSTIKEENKRSLHVFEMSVLRKILGRSRRDHIRNVDILKELSLDNNPSEVLILFV